MSLLLLFMGGGGIAAPIFMPNSHPAFLFDTESAFGSYIDPTMTARVIEADFNASREFIVERGVRSNGRAATGGHGGYVDASASVSTYLRTIEIPWLIRSAFGDRSVAAAGSGYRNKFLPSSDTFDTLSFQNVYTDSLAEFIRGAKLGSLGISATSREYAMCNMEFIAKDATISGVDWSDGSSAPSITTPLPTIQNNLPFTFYQGVLKTGGSVSMVSNEIVVSGGTARSTFDSISLNMDFGLQPDGYVQRVGDPTRYEISEGPRTINLEFEILFDSDGAEFYGLWRNGSPTVAQLFFQGPEYESGNRYEMIITIPNLVYSQVDSPSLNNSYALRRQTVSGIAIEHSSLGVDVGIVIQTTEDLS